MAGPWEKYQQQAEQGPWSKYQARAAGPEYPLMSQLNKGIAQAAGGLVDFLNPFDQPHALNPFPEGTGSAQAGLEQAMQAGGIEVAQQQPQNVAEGLMRGAGQAAGSMIPVAGAAGAMRSAGGMTGQLADDAFRALTAPAAPVAEVASGGLSGGAEQAAEQAGAPEWVQNMAAVAAPMSIPAAAGAAKAAAKISPVGALARRAASAVAPYTTAGAKGIATERMQSLAGGPERAEQLARSITRDNPLELTPAQQTGDPNMLAVEDLAASQDPNLRASLEARRAQSSDLARGNIEAMGGDVERAQSVLAERRRQFTAELQQKADAALQAAGGRVSGIADVPADSELGSRITSEVRAELEKQVARERELWGAVPQDVPVSTQAARQRFSELDAQTPQAQKDDIPEVARMLLSADGNRRLQDVENVREVHGLYSKLREVARNARAGETPSRNRARIADELADAILDDLNASDASEPFNTAVAFSRSLHDVFDQGAVSRILKRSRSGVSSIEPETAATRTVGRGGVEGMVASRQLEEAGGARETIMDYIAGQFGGSAINPGTGEVTTAGARRFMAKNRELLARYPELRSEIEGAVSQQETAQQLADRVTRRIAALEDAKQSAVARFIGGSADKAVSAIIDAKNPIQAARRIANEARKDTSGQALDGVKGAIANHLINSARRTRGAETGLDATALNRVLEDPKLTRAIGQIFTPVEIGRLRRIGSELAKAQAATDANIGTELSGAQANRLVEMVARVAAARHGANMGGGGGGSIQTAQMASSRMRDFLNHLTKDKASQMIADAVSDPELFRALLTETGSVKGMERAVPKFLPYLAGAATATAQE
jgi:hypothetical protein